MTAIERMLLRAYQRWARKHRPNHHNRPFAVVATGALLWQAPPRRSAAELAAIQDDDR